MKDVRFYLEYKSKREKRRGQDTGTCLAVYTDTIHKSGDVWVYDCLGALMANPSPNTDSLCHSSVSPEYLASKCKRVGLAKVQEIHPNLLKELRN